MQQKTILLLALALILFSCSNKKHPESLIEQSHLFLSVENNFTSSKQIESTELFLIDSTQEKINVKLKHKTHIQGKTAKGNTFFSKKVFNLFQISTNEQVNKIKESIEIQEKLKKEDLINLTTKLITVKTKSGNMDFLFQEGLDKLIVEGNKRRDGVIFSIHNTSVNIEHSGPVTNVDSLKKELNTKIQDVISSRTDVYCLFDMEKINKFVSVFSTNENKNFGIGYYLNPATNKIELFTFHSDDNDDKFYSHYLVRHEKIIDGNNENLEHPCFDKNYLIYFEELNDTLVPIGNNFKINQPVIIPFGHVVSIKKGCRIDFSNNAYLCSYSPVHFSGTAKDSIIFTSKDKTSQGIHILNASGKSSLNYVSISNFNNLNTNGWILPSAVTFYESPVDIKNCSFRNNDCEDGVNIFRSAYRMENTTISNTFSDAFDADFSDGEIINCTFRNSGNDGIDISGSNLIVKNCTFNIIADKALSAGENSNMKIDSAYITNASLGVVAKDLSVLEIKNSTIINSEVVYSAFQKKNEFGPSRITAKNNIISNYKIDKLIETGSSLIIDEVEILEFRDDVKDILYGNEYGKKTVK